MTRHVTLKIATLCGFALILSACGFSRNKPYIPEPRIPTIPSGQPTQSSQPTPILPDHAQLADNALQAARALANKNQIDEALATLEGINKRQLSSNQSMEVVSYQVKLALQQRNPSAALNYLAPQTLPDTLNSTDLVHLYRLRADAFRALNQPVEAAKALIYASEQTTSNLEQQALHNDIWAYLLQVTSLSLVEEAKKNTNTYAEQGWLTRALRFIINTSETDRVEALLSWEINWPDHPASQLPPSLNTERVDLAIPDNFAQQPDNFDVALFLPLQGQFKVISDSIISGFNAAKGVLDDTYEPVNIIDSTLINSPDELFRQAMAQGVKLIIGPLTREFITRLAQTEEHPIPVLALNSVEAGVNPPLQFDLAPDHDAFSLAYHALNQDFQKAMVIHSDEPLSERQAQNIIGEFSKQGGVVTHQLRFNPDENLSSQIRDFLMADPLIASTMPVRSRSGMNVSVEHETDVIFLATNAKDARLIRPLLLYHFAGNIPVYATSQVFQAPANARRDTDMNGVYFVDIPWHISQPSETQVSLGLLSALDTQNEFSKLYAFGADAFLISQNLRVLLDQRTQLQGETGRIMMSNNRRFQRILPLAQFIDGIPQMPDENP